MRYALLRCAALRYTALRCATLRCAALRCATLRCATLRYATLRYAALRCAARRCAALRCAVLRSAACGRSAPVRAAGPRYNVVLAFVTFVYARTTLYIYYIVLNGERDSVLRFLVDSLNFVTFAESQMVTNHEKYICGVGPVHIYDLQPKS